MKTVNRTTDNPIPRRVLLEYFRHPDGSRRHQYHTSTGKKYAAISAASVERLGVALARVRHQPDATVYVYRWGIAASYPPRKEP